MKIGDWELHPACVNMPPLDPVELTTLRESIREIGQLQPIVRWKADGSILDGRHRLAVCVELGIEPRFEVLDVSDPWAWCWSINVERRHLEPGRRVALRLLYDQALQDMLAAAAAAAGERQRATQFKASRSVLDSSALEPAEYRAPDVEVPFPRDADEQQHETTDGDRDTVRATLPAPEPVRPRVLLARTTAVAERTAEKALRVKARSPELLEQVATGKVSLHRAERQARRASNSEWAEFEAYCTPLWPVELLASSGYLGQPGSIGLAVEPCVGSGAIVRGLAGLVKLWITGDIREVEPVPEAWFHFHHSWLDGEPRAKLSRAELRRLAKAKLVITNPPFSRAQEVVEAAWELCPWADVWVLQRRSWHDQARDAWFARHQPDELNLSPRIRFEWPDGTPVAEGTDNTIYTWFGFSAAKKQPCLGPLGGISRTLLRADRALEAA
jgi:hypothetical protein